MRRQQIKTALRIYREQGASGLADAILRKIAMGGVEDWGTHWATFFDRFRVRKITAGLVDVLAGPVDDAWTEYLNWLSFANAGMLTRGNVDCMDYAIRHLPSAAPIVEIGSFCGLSSNVLTYLKEKHNKNNQLITCDKWIFEGAEEGGMLADSRTVTHAQYRDFVKESFVRNVNIFSRLDLPYAIETLSDDFFRCWSESETCRDVFSREVQLGGPISFCYIDGNHSYEFAKRDYENTDKYLEQGGFILFDDSADASGFEVNQVAREVAKNQRYELIAKNPNYFFRKN